MGRLAKAVRRVPSEAWICAAVACLNAVCWSLITPPFQVPDEPDHFAYVQQLADTGSLPVPKARPHSKEEEVALKDLHFVDVRQRPGPGVTLRSQAQQRNLEKGLRAFSAGAPRAQHSAGLAGSEPPLYYAIEAIPYKLGSGGTLLDRLALMRLVSALMAGVTALFAFLFLRETLPAFPWSWIVGGLGVALFPLIGFMSGAVTPEAMLYAVSAALFYLLARAFRRGLTPRLATAIGLLLAVGLLTKLNFIGLMPGTGLGLVLLAIRAARRSRAEALRALLLAAGIAVTPVLAFIMINLLSNRAAFGVVTAASRQTLRHGGIVSELSYIWQFYLPRLPGMRHDFVGLFTTRRLWFNGLVGLYGWLDTSFPAWVYDLALLPAGAIALLAAKTLLGVRSALRARIAEPLVYLVMAAGLMGLVGADGFLEFPREVGNYAHPRYLMPLVVFWGVALALAARGAGRRWGPVLGAALVVLALAHDIFSQLLVVSRYYG